MRKLIKILFFCLVCLSVTAALWVSKELLFPFVTSKAFFFRIVIELALPLYLYLILADPKLRPSLKNPVSLSLMVFLIINIISSFTGVSVIRSLFGNFERMGGAYYIGHLVALYFYVLALGQMQGRYLQWFLKFLLFMAFVIAGNGIFGWLGWPTIIQDASLPGRVSSTLGNPIYLGSYLIIPLYLSVFFSFQTRKLPAKIGYWFLALMFFWGIFLSVTRGAMVGLIFGSFLAAVVYLFLAPRGKARNYGLLVVSVFVVVAGILFVFNGKLLPQGSSLQRVFRLNDSNTQARFVQWKIALSGYKDHPFFGTGPENYYIIANQYYNPEIFQYDRSWFDKPHNYLLEILVTNGAMGFAAYLALMVFVVMALFRGYRAELYGLAEFVLLLGALLAYQIQNLTVFDTVPASLMFYSFMGFAGFIWGISGREPKKVKNGTKGIVAYSQALPWAVFGVTAAVAVYGVYATNLVPMAAAKNVNYGYAYSGVDPVKSKEYFDKVASSPFNFDKTESAGRFAEYAMGFARKPGEQNKDLSLKVLDDCISYMQEALAVQPDYPILWQRLYTLYLYKTFQNNNSPAFFAKAQDALNQSVALAPQREESYLNLVQLSEVKGDIGQAESLLEKAMAIFPTDQNIKARLALVYNQQGKLDEAAQLMEKALAQNYVFGSYAEMTWLRDYYVKAKKFDMAISLQQRAEKIEPDNIQIFMDLAKLYALAGKYDAARTLAESIINFDATKKAEMQALINSLPKTASSTPAGGK